MITLTDITSASRKELLELLNLTERWGDMTDSKFYIYQPNPVPLKFHNSSAKIRALFGGNRSSKTYSTMVDLAAQFNGKAPASLIGIIPEHRLDQTRRIRLNMNDYPNSFMKVIKPYAEQLIPSDAITDVIKDQGRIKAFVNAKGGFIEFMQYDQEVTKFQGSSRHVCAYDEEPPQAIRDENQMRLVDTDGEEIYSLTPINEANYGASSRWIYDEIYLRASIITRYKDGKYDIRTNPEGDSNIHCFFASIYDNVAIKREAADRILANFSEEERKVRQEGEFLFLGGLVYKTFKEDKHLIDPFDSWYKGNSADDYTLYCAIDPHPRTPHAILYMVVNQYSIKYIVDELFVATNTAKELVELHKIKCQGKPVNVILIDPFANTPDPSTGSCFAWDLADAGMYPVPINAMKDKSHGILMTQQAFANNELFVTRNCTRFRYEITHYTWDSWKKDTTNIKGEKQKPVDKDDHMMENLYRLILFKPTYVSTRTDVKNREIFYEKRSGMNPITGY